MEPFACPSTHPPTHTPANPQALRLKLRSRSLGSVRAQSGSLADQLLLAVGPSGSLPPHPGLPLTPLQGHTQWPSALSQHLYHVGTIGDSRCKIHPLATGSHWSALSIPRASSCCRACHPVIAAPPQWQKLPSVCQTSPHYVKGELKQFRKSLHESWQLSQLFFLFILCSLFLLWL